MKNKITWNGIRIILDYQPVDLISRQAAIEKISETIWDTAIANDVKTILKELPSAQPLQWMPLPEPPEAEEQ